MASYESADELKYLKTKDRINEIRSELEKLKDKPGKEKLIDKIYRELETLEQQLDPKKEELKMYLLPIGDVDEFVFDRDIAPIDHCHPVTVQVLKRAAAIAIGYFNQINSPPDKYYAVDLIRATKYWHAGYFLDLTFTATTEGSVGEAETFGTRMNFFGSGSTRVESVKKMS